jgi:hypothetical protein
MCKVKPTLLGATFILWALAVIISFASAPALVVDPETGEQVNTFELMANMKDLPAQSYDAF